MKTVKMRWNGEQPIQSFNGRKVEVGGTADIAEGSVDFFKTITLQTGQRRGQSTPRESARPADRSRTPRL